MLHIQTNLELQHLDTIYYEHSQTNVKASFLRSQVTNPIVINIYTNLLLLLQLLLHGSCSI